MSRRRRRPRTGRFVPLFEDRKINVKKKHRAYGVFYVRPVGIGPTAFTMSM